MKKLPLISVSLFLLTISINAQDITNKLGGDTDAVKYEVINSSDKVLLHVQGDGKVGIGKTDPQTKLDVDGTIKATGIQLQTGATSGHILTSDGSGNATWQARPNGLILRGNAVGNSNIETSSSSFTPMADMSLAINSTGGNLLVSFTTTIMHMSAGLTNSEYGIFVDGVSKFKIGIDLNQYNKHSISFNHLVTGISLGTHTVDIRWSSPIDGKIIRQWAATQGLQRTLTIMEFL